MAGNSIGQLFKVTTFGESHGQAVGCIVEGTPPGMTLNSTDLQVQLDRRRPGRSNYTSSRQESDQVQILSGIFEGVTTGTSIGLIVNNCDQRSQDYEVIKDRFRPGHADYTYEQKYGIRDYRGGGRASARETVARVAAGAIAKKFLKDYLAITINGFLAQMGSIKCEPQSLSALEEANKNYFFCPDEDKLPYLEKLLMDLKKKGDSIGAKITVIASNVPAGWGEPVFDKLDAELAHALMSINAVKGVEIGDGFAVIEQYGSANRDEMTKKGFLSNHAGGILGGISSGQPIIATLALKPTSSIALSAQSLNKQGEEVTISVKGRHDPCVALRAVPVAEAMVAIVLMDHYLRYRGQCG